jgi:outer membrane protein assembly factor BamB
MRHWALIIVLSFTVAGCDTWFGADEKPPLPGQRVPVLVHQRDLAADAAPGAQPIVLPEPISNTDWPQAGGYPHHAMRHLRANVSGSPQWRVSVGAGINDSQPRLPPPVVAGGRIFAMDADHRVSAFDAGSGALAWQTELAADTDDDDVITGGLAYDQGRVFASTGFAEVVALNAQTGAELWRKRVSGPIHSSPTVAAGRLMVISIDNVLHVLSAETGARLWTFQSPSDSASLVGGASVAVDAGVVVAPFASGELVGLRIENGRPLWTETLTSSRRTDELATIAQIRARPVIDGGRVFALSYAGNMAALDLRSGQRMWDRSIGGLEQPWVAGETVFLVTNESEVVAVAAGNGRIRWVTKLPAFEDEEEKRDPILWKGPVLMGNQLVFVGSNAQLLVLSPDDGKITAQHALPDGAAADPVVAGGTLYVLTVGGDLLAFR